MHLHELWNFSFKEWCSYFNVVPRNGIYEIDMHDFVPNVNSVYNVSNKRVKHNLECCDDIHSCLRLAFLPWRGVTVFSFYFLVELANFHDVSTLRFVLASNMLNREARSLSSKLLKLRETVFMLKGEQSVSSATIAKLEAKLLSIGGGSSVIDFVTVHDLMSENEKLKKDIASPQELSQLAITLAIEASLKAEIESLKEKIDSAVDDRSLMVTDLLPHAVKFLFSSDSFSSLLVDLQKKVMLIDKAQDFEELAGMGLDFQLKDMKDYEPDVVDSFDKSIDNFYRVEFPYLDLLAYHARKSLGLLKSLEPPSLPPRVPSGAGTSSNPFI
ncbi:hypothetical protein Tco_1302510 [Tanacetum coccineum]